ncbi:hypothetical protein ACU4GD_13635 [Cupriavidus basilensis]
MFSLLIYVLMGWLRAVCLWPRWWRRRCRPPACTGRWRAACSTHGRHRVLPVRREGAALPRHLAPVRSWPAAPAGSSRILWYVG